jgi:hypothetical protein
MPKEEIVTTLEEINEKAKLQSDEYGDFNDPTDVEVEVPLAKKAKAEPEEKLEIEVVDDTPQEDRGRKKMKSPPKEEDEADEVTNYNEKVQRRMDELKRAWHDERRAKERAAREQQAAVDYAKKVADENKRLLKQLQEGEKTLIEQAKGKADAILRTAKKSLQEAQESGDSEKVAEAMAEITRSTMEKESWDKYTPQYTEAAVEEAYNRLTALQDENKEVNYQQPVQQAAPPDEKALAWYNKNTWFGADEEMTAFAYGLHQKLVNDGIDPRSDKYYERIDARLRQVFPDKFESDSGADEEDAPRQEPVKRVEKRQQATVVSPATRTTPSKKIVLTKSQVAIARRLGVPLDVYAKQVALQENR